MTYGVETMEKSYIITDKSGRQLRQATLSEPEARMVAKAGFRVFDPAENSHGNPAPGDELTPQLTGLFEHEQKSFF